MDFWITVGQVLHICAIKLCFLIQDIFYTYTNGVDKLICLRTWCRIREIWAKRTSSSMPYSWQSAIYNLHMDIKEPTSTNIWSELIFTEHFGWNSSVLGLAIQSNHWMQCKLRLDQNFLCVPFLFHKGYLQNLVASDELCWENLLGQKTCLMAHSSILV